MLGPILAGFIISANIGGLTWRPVFLINIVLGTAGLVAALRVLPRDEPDPTGQHRRPRRGAARGEHARR